MADYWEKTLRDLGLKAADPDADTAFANRNKGMEFPWNPSSPPTSAYPVATNEPMVFPGYQAPLPDSMPDMPAPPSQLSENDDQDVPMNDTLANDPNLMWGDSSESVPASVSPGAKFSGMENTTPSIKSASYGEKFGPPDPVGALLPKESSTERDYLGSLLSSAYGSDLNDEALQRAQKSRDTQELYANLSKAGSQVGAAIAGIKPQTDIQDSILKSSGQGVEDIITRRKGRSDELNMKIHLSEFSDKKLLKDPTSNISKAYRAFAKQASPELAQDPSFESLSAQGVKELLPGIDMMMKVKATREEKSRYSDEKSDKDTNTRFAKVGEKLAAELARKNTVFGNSMSTYSAAEKIQAVVKGRNTNELDSREITELARQMDAMLSSGSPTVSGMKKLIPESARANIEKLSEFLTNKRKGAQMSSFVNQMLETVEREKHLAAEQIQRVQAKLLSAYPDLREKDPERWNNMMRLNGIPEDVLDLPVPGTKKQGLPPGVDLDAVQKEMKKRGIKH